jgi:hypothetical protein
MEGGEPADEAMECAVRDDEDGTENAAFELVAGTAAVIVAGFVAAVLFPGAEPAGRVVVMALAVGLFAALTTDWRASVGVAVIAALLFVGFLTHKYAVLTGDPAPWSFAPLIGLATLLGRGCHRLTQPAPDPYPRNSVECEPFAAEADRPHVLVWPDRHPVLPTRRKSHSS